MSKFQVLIHGANFLLDFDGKKQRMGFYATRLVEAASEDEAESAAVEMLRTDDYLNSSVLNEKTDPPMLYVEEIVKISRLKRNKVVNTGFTFYVESEE